jgi:hypothetical protein
MYFNEQSILAKLLSTTALTMLFLMFSSWLSRWLLKRLKPLNLHVKLADRDGAPAGDDPFFSFGVFKRLHSDVLAQKKK